MRGWHNESYRHSLAARGLPTNYLYHGTTTGHYVDIRKEGLIPGPVKNWGESEDHIYFTLDEEKAFSWGKHATKILKEAYEDYPGELPGRIFKAKPIVLRIRKDELGEYTGGCLFKDSLMEELSGYEDHGCFEIWEEFVPPEMLEVKTPSGWKRLKS